jgi:iron only hydrogenase large subunit-like protein
MQSHHELYKILEKNQQLPSSERTLVIVSISPQSRASLATKYGLTLQQVTFKVSFMIQVHSRLLWFFKQKLGVDHVFDTAFSRDFSLQEAAHEFIRRYQATMNGDYRLPLLSGVCPGWICYAEKTHGHIVPFIDTTKSPQQIMGSLVKHYLCQKLEYRPDQCYHVTIMPCYDKKLEASRSDFYNDIYRTRDVDCVITTGECEVLLQEQSISLANCPEMSLETIFSKVGPSESGSIELYGTEGTSSGGYLAYILRYAAFHLFGISVTETQIMQGTGSIRIKPGRNADYTEYVLVGPPGHTQEGQELLCFATAYGFRNIQNLVRKVKTATIRKIIPAVHFVEVMACPSGCINGGGQLKATEGEVGLNSVEVSRKWVAASESMYRSLVKKEPPEENRAVQLVYQ